MARRLPTDPDKRRAQVFKRVYTHLEHWKSLMEDRGMEAVITDEATGEDIYIWDLLVGLDSLPPRQRQAFELICLRGYTETAARDILLPNSKSSTPVQQYADIGLARMVEAYDLKQQGRWPPPEEVRPKKPRKSRPRKEPPMADVKIPTPPLHPLLRKHLEDARRDIQVQIDGLHAALRQTEEMLGFSSPPPCTINTPEPLARPEGKPDLQEMAKSLATAG